MKLYWGVLAISMGLSAADVAAQSLKDKQYFAEQEQYLAKQVPHTNQKCDTSIAVKFDWSTPPKPEDRNTYSAYGYCEATLDGVRRVCEASALGKDAVKQSIKTITCGFGPQRDITLKDGAIDYKIDFKSSNDADYVFEYLQNNL
jgi:hypothetical protein